MVCAIKYHNDYQDYPDYGFPKGEATFLLRLFAHAAPTDTSDRFKANQQQSKLAAERTTMPKERGYILNADAFPQDDTYVTFDLMYTETAEELTSHSSASFMSLYLKRPDQGHHYVRLSRGRSRYSPMTFRY
jgi:hypothetical protein